MSHKYMLYDNTVLTLVHLNPSFMEGNSPLSLFNQQAMLYTSLSMDNFQVHSYIAFSLDSTSQLPFYFQK